MYIIGSLFSTIILSVLTAMIWYSASAFFGLKPLDLNIWAGPILCGWGAVSLIGWGVVFLFFD